MTTTQKTQPADAFRTCCGRRIALPHASTCPTLDRGPLTIKRVGARVTCTRASGTTVLRFRVTSVAKKAEQAIRQDPSKLDECIAMMQAGLWS